MFWTMTSKSAELDQVTVQICSEQFPAGGQVLVNCLVDAMEDETNIEEVYDNVIKGDEYEEVE